MYHLVNLLAEEEGSDIATPVASESTDLSESMSSTAESSSNSLLSSSANPNNSTPWPTYVFLGVFLVAFVGMMFWNNRKTKKQKEEQEATLHAIRPGNKVKTVGGICGIVVELNPEENTFVLETGSEACGKSYMKFDMQAIYDTDAKPAPKDEKDEKPAEAPKQDQE